MTLPCRVAALFSAIACVFVASEALAQPANDNFANAQVAVGASGAGGYHALATGRPPRNLDPFLCGQDLIAPLFRHGARGGPIHVTCCGGTATT